MAVTLPEASEHAGLVSRVIGDWPSERRFRAQEILSAHPSLADDSSAVVSLAKEEFIRRLEAGDDVSIARFAERFPDVKSQLVPRLQNVLGLGREVGLWGSGPVPQWPCVGGELFGYHLVEHIGSGAFSRVYLAEETTIGNRRVVLKVTTRGHMEISLLGPLDHAHLPQILSAHRDESTGMTAVSMRLVGRRTSLDLLDLLEQAETRSQGGPSRGGQIDWSDPLEEYIGITRRVVAEVADALAFTHQQGILHLDVKPSNIVLTDRLSAVLIDFNAAVPRSLSHSVHFCGTPVYAAPELLEAIVANPPRESHVTEAADVYSLGVVLFQLLTGELPWGDVPDGSIRHIAAELLEAKRGPLRRASDLNPKVPPVIDELLLRALAAQPGERIASAAEFRDLLGEPPLLGGPPERRTPMLRRPVVVTAGMAVACSAALLLGLQPESPGPLSVDAPRTASVLVGATAEESLQQGWRALRWGKTEEAFATFEAARTAFDDPRLEASWAYAGLLDRRISIPQARQGFQEAFDRGLHADAGVCCDLAYCLMALKKHSAARSVLDDALQQHPRNKVLLFHRSFLEFMLEDDPSPAFAKALVDLDVKWPRVYLDTAVAVARRESALTSDSALAAECYSYLLKARELGLTRAELEREHRLPSLARLLSPETFERFRQSLPSAGRSNSPDVVEPSFGARFVEKPSRT